MLSALSVALDENGNYPTNADGETYGSGLLAEVVGCDPDLIEAEGVGGVHGYVRSDDLDSVFTTSTEVAAYTKALENNSFVPLYDVDGNVIGTFERKVGHTGNDPEFAGMNIEEVQAALAKITE